MKGNYIFDSLNSGANVKREGEMELRVETYRLKTSDNNPIRMATRVIFPDGKTVRFLERLSKREAIKQAKLL